jgi:hypothetical protein
MFYIEQLREVCQDAPYLFKTGQNEGHIIKHLIKRKEINRHSNKTFHFFRDLV